MAGGDDRAGTDDEFCRPVFDADLGSGWGDDGINGFPSDFGYSG
jgi:hypothetical protein